MLTTTRRLLLFVLLTLFFVTFVVADPRGGRGNDNDVGDDDRNGEDDDDGPDDDGDGATGNTPAGSGGTPANIPNGNSTGLGGLQGDMQCPGSKLMCVTGIVNGTSITYELQSTGAENFGWMAIGFGTQMPNTPMVIMWANADGSITLSQRQAPAEVMPTPVPNPPHVATAVPQLSSLTGSQPKVVFSIPGTPSLTNLIWAFGTTKPAKPADSTLLQHIDSGTFTLDLTKTIPSGAGGAGVNGSIGALPLPQGSVKIPFLPYQKLIIAHAAIVSLGFLILLPSGALLARLTRTYNNKWFKGHWILQFGLGGPAVIIGCILGFLAVKVQGGGESNTAHKTIGKVLLALYLIQCALGAFIHFIKIRLHFGPSRPPQNYLHAILGLAIIGLAFYQARLGYTQEWPNTTGRPPVPNGVNIAWIVLLVIVAVAYFGGLVYLPRQYRQERKSRRRAVNVSGSTRDDEEIHELDPHRRITYDMYQRQPL